MCATTPGVLHAIRDAPIAEDAQAIEGKAGPCAVPHEALAPFVVVGFDTDRGLPVKAVTHSGERASLLRPEARVRIARVDVVAMVERGEGPTTEGDVRASFEGTGLGLLVAAIFGSAIVDEATFAEPARRAISDAPDDAVEHVPSRRREAVEANVACVVAGEDAVGDDRMEMKVQVETAAELLDVVDGRVLAPRDVGGAPLLERARRAGRARERDRGHDREREGAVDMAADDARALQTVAEDIVGAPP